MRSWFSRELWINQHSSALHPADRSMNTVGWLHRLPLPDTEAQIVNRNGKPLKVGETGELAVKGPQVMKGY
jgi:acyl-CoA synthetase (AMP-forming)/AMP-acid ligase II